MFLLTNVKYSHLFKRRNKSHRLKSLELVSNRTGNCMQDKLCVSIIQENRVYGDKHAREDKEMGHGMEHKEAKL